MLVRLVRCGGGAPRRRAWKSVSRTPLVDGKDRRPGVPKHRQDRFPETGRL